MKEGERGFASMSGAWKGSEGRVQWGGRGSRRERRRRSRDRRRRRDVYRRVRTEGGDGAASPVAREKKG